MKRNNIFKLIIPNTRTNIIAFSIFIIGIITGSIFIMVINTNDKSLVVEHITKFFSNVNSSDYSYLDSLKNMLSLNYFYVIVIWVLGLSILGILVNIFLTYLKGFIIGFTTSSLIITYGFKSILAVILYIIPHTLINSLVIIVLTIYSITFSRYLLIQIFQKKDMKTKNFMKKYLIILLIAVALTLVSSISEVYLFPFLLKLIIKLYVWTTIIPNK